MVDQVINADSLAANLARERMQQRLYRLVESMPDPDTGDSYLRDGYTFYVPPELVQVWFDLVAVLKRDVWDPYPPPKEPAP